MANPAENALSEVLAAYAFAGEVVGAARFGQGHINDTFCVYTQTAEGDCVRYILQRMSAAAFKRPDQLMQNIVGVTDYLRDLIEKNGGDAARETMTVLRTKNGAAYFTDSEGGAWRVYPFVENTLCLQKAETPELFYASAKAFGNFQRMLKDYPADTLFETIEKFHDTENRLANFEKALAADKLGRAKDCAPEIAFVKAHAADCSVALEALRAGTTTFSDSNVIPEQTAYEIGGAAIINGGPNTENAKIFMDWLLTKEAQELNVESSYRYPVRTDVAAPEGLPALEDVDLVDYDRDQATAMRESVLEKFEAEIMANRT